MTLLKKSKIVGACTLGIAAVTLAGCSAKWNTAFRDRPIPADGPSVITIDAKQRHVLIQPVTEKDKDEVERTRLLLCAEPAPDVFAAIAASGSGSLGIDAKSQSGEGAFGLSASETAATIERTQTINLLRESFFRTCERYLNGAISKESFIVQAGRDARAMVAVLAIEQLTGVVKPPATIISGPAVTANARLSSELVTLYAAAAKRREEAEAGFKGKEADLTADCSTGSEDEKKACDDRKKKATDAKAELDAANARVAEIVKLSDNVGQGTSALAGTMAGTNQAGGGEGSSSDVAEVADTVLAIVKEVTRVDDMKLYCIENFNDIDPASELFKTCNTLLVAATQTETAVLSGVAAIEAAKLQAEIDGLVAQRATRAERFDAVRTRRAADCTGLLANLNLLPSEKRGVCNAGRTLSLQAFGRLTPTQQDLILTLFEKDE
jgi:hypothetical protein